MRKVCSLGFAIWVLGFGILSAQIAMPDPSLIHGRAIPAGDLAMGTVTVRVVREAIGNNITGQDVRLTVNGQARTAKTDAQGRAEFPGLTPGAEVRADATVDGEALTSDSFMVPASGGLRVILVAGLKNAAARREQEEAAAAAAPPVKGSVVFGPNSRVLMEFRDDTLRVFYILDIVNNARARVDIGGPVILQLPEGAAGASILEGSSPTATVDGDVVTVVGPFSAGLTSVQLGFQLLYSRSDVAIEQTWPVALEQLNVAIEKIGDVSISSPQFSTVGDVTAPETGTPFLLASGNGMPAGSTLTVQLSNLPVHSRAPVYTALAVAGLVIAGGLWVGFRGHQGKRAGATRLAERREELLSELAALEDRRRRSGSLAGSDDARHQRIVSELEQIYGELDHVDPGPQGGGKDVAA
jgi:hypothetical protein